MHRRAAALILTAIAFLLPGCGDRTGFVFPGSTDVASEAQSLRSRHDAADVEDAEGVDDADLDDGGSASGGGDQGEGGGSGGSAQGPCPPQYPQYVTIDGIMLCCEGSGPLFNGPGGSCLTP